LPALDVLHDLALGHSFVAMCCSSLYCMTAGFSPNGTSFGRLCHVCIVRGSGKWGYEKSSDSVLAENRTIFLLR